MIQTLTEWLESLKCTNVTACTVTIKGTTYQGASYIDPSHNSQERIYLLGKLPACYRRSTRTCFRVTGDTRDWYVAAYMPAERLADEYLPFHPFGEHFMLVPWGVPDGSKIDRYAERPYARVSATLTKELTK